MKASDYIVQYLIEQGITDVFGYPGGMVTHLMDSLGKRQREIKTHVTYHEQAAAFSACGYAQASHKVGVAFATSGPGATNLITGIGNAYFDSIPTVFITGQVNTFESKGNTRIRQKAFQETSIVPMVREITKAAFYVSDVSCLKKILEDAFTICQSARKGPVLIDIPMNVFRAEISDDCHSGQKVPTPEKSSCCRAFADYLHAALTRAKRPCLLLGNGIKIEHQVENIREILKLCPMPVVSSMIAVDIIPESQELKGLYYGFVGAYGNRTANFVVAKSDLLISLGSRLDVRQVGGKREAFAPDAEIIRVDIDEAELSNKIRDDDRSFKMHLGEALAILKRELENGQNAYGDWIKTCKKIKEIVKLLDEREPNRIINYISTLVPDQYSIVADVGQCMVWVAQSFKMKPGQRVYFSGGMGSMGYALPAAIGVHYATKRPVICFVGDGGFQMNLQELQFLKREQIPVSVIVLNNSALGMIRHFQEMYFEKNYYFTVPQGGYDVPDFMRIAQAYGLKATKVCSYQELSRMNFDYSVPQVIEIMIEGDTYVFPKLEFGKPNQDQEPLLDRNTYDYLMRL